MSLPENYTLTQAVQAYSAANTPLYLIRKLKEDSEVRAISEALSGSDIVEALKQAVGSAPDTPRADVQPYALLVALWFKPEVDHLREAAKISAPEWRWFSYVAAVLLEAFSPVLSQTISASATAAYSQRIDSSAPTSRVVIIP